MFCEFTYYISYACKKSVLYDKKSEKDFVVCKLSGHVDFTLFFSYNTDFFTSIRNVCKLAEYVNFI
jgi:hypothetical protein